MTHPTTLIRRVDYKVLITMAVLLGGAAAVAAYRLIYLNVDIDHLVPKRVYTLQIVQTFSGNGGEVSLAAYLPESDEHQQILVEEQVSDQVKYLPHSKDGNRIGKWAGAKVVGEETVRYTARITTTGLRYKLNDDIKISDIALKRKAETIAATKTIQSDAPEIRRLADSLVPADQNALKFLKAAFDYTAALGFKPFKGTTDALTAFRLGEASCNGKGRLLAAVLRAKRIPTRLVGGLVMTEGSKRTSHQWVEALVGGRWIPMDPTNGHFAEIPEHYLSMYRGDQVFFKHSADIGFEYAFVVQKTMVPPQEVDPAKQVLGFFAVFNKMGIPLELLKSIIMIPLGGVIVIIFRNVVGLRTFGTFLPVLIAVACRNTGLFWGLIGFTGIIGVVSLLRHFIAKLQLLHSPQLGVLLTAVIGLLLASSVIGAQYDISGLARVSLFPVVIIAITAERFALIEIEEGRLTAWKILAESILVVSICFLVINSLSLQIIMLAFPELLLFVGAVNIWIGRWVGLRASEWFRFRWFFEKPANA